MFEQNKPRRSLGHGVALPVVLMFLLVITVLGTLGVRRAITGEALSRNQLDYEVARQAAEAALRDGERDIISDRSTLRVNALCPRDGDRPLTVLSSSLPFWSNACPRGQCRFDGTYYAGSNYGNSPAVVANPMPWWPTINGKGGLWGADNTKPSVALGAGVNCNFSGSVPLGTFTGARQLSGVARQPEYILEYFDPSGGMNPVAVRVTARGFGANVNTEVVMQSFFRPFTN